MPSMWVHFFAVVLEVGIISRLLAHADAVGLGLCIVYAWWSATLSMVLRLAKGKTD